MFHCHDNEKNEIPVVTVRLRGAFGPNCLTLELSLRTPGHVPTAFMPATHAPLPESRKKFIITTTSTFKKEKRKKLKDTFTHTFRKVDSFVLGPAVINTQTLKVDKQ